MQRWTRSGQGVTAVRDSTLQRRRESAAAARSSSPGKDGLLHRCWAGAPEVHHTTLDDRPVPGDLRDASTTSYPKRERRLTRSSYDREPGNHSP